MVIYNEYEEDKVIVKKVIEILFILFICVIGVKYLEVWVKIFEICWLMIFDFVYVLFIGVFIINLFEVIKLCKVDVEMVDILGMVFLLLFFVMVLMSLKLWNIFDLVLLFLVIFVI